MTGGYLMVILYVILCVIGLSLAHVAAVLLARRLELYRENDELRADNAKLRAIIGGLVRRVAVQSEIISRLAEGDIPARSTAAQVAQRSDEELEEARMVWDGCPHGD